MIVLYRIIQTDITPWENAEVAKNAPTWLCAIGS